ncbi:putative polyketide synthase [Bimuria novae-zelandiae CBS 107.79]|uniref:Putative polyketide synthase n=1 Tax=Bimuria novae-zelandiae CBS 107.79 TaxID=1447943 RepID=A0A6A5VKG2_9PLEO|nr:putative polyketide synthase [Bimuria novae-zelandiae CBS 107.79]
MPYIPSVYSAARLLLPSHPVTALFSFTVWLLTCVFRRSFSSMSVSLFPDQLPDTRGLIRRAQEAKKRTVLVKSFLEKAYSALRAEVWNLPRDVRNQIPPFNSVYDLSERHAASKIQRVEVSSALLVIAELANFIGHHEQNNRSLDTTDDLLVGTGLGQLAAAAVACAANIIDLPDIAVESVRLAFRAGAVVENFSIPARHAGESDASWSLVVPGTFEEIQAELQSLQDAANLPVTSRAFISTVSESASTVNGSPARLEWLTRNSKLFQSPAVQEIESVGVWHAPDIYSEEQISEVTDSRSEAVSQIPAPRRATISASTGKRSEATSAIALFTEAVTDILRRPVQWSAITKTVASDSLLSQATELAGFEASQATKSLQAAIETEGSSITLQDLGHWVTADTGSKPVQNTANVAIVGMSGRFPGAADVEALWQVLVQGKDMHKRIPKDRFDPETHHDPNGKVNNTSHTPYGAFIEEPGLFDARFFHMSPTEATQTDPMHRLALVTAYEALEQSGFVLNSTPSSQQDRVGTFYGQTSDDWREVNAAQNIGTYFIPGGVRAFAPGRISYYFGFRGPSYSVDTACSSSMAAIQIACSSLRSGECDTAIAGGANILTAPDIFAGLSRGQFLSKTGACKTWDSKADGYCRADGVGSVVLKRLDDAINDKNNILGVILGTATNHSADAISITHPHAGNQAYLYQSVLHEAGVDPLDISYVEMHGTGTQAGDMAEIGSVTTVFAPEHARGSDPAKTLHIGAVKSNIGHGEAAAGIGALIKVLLMLQKNMIPKHVGIKHEINPGFPDLVVRNIKVPFDNTPYPRPEGKGRTVFLNNFSAAGGNTAMLIRDGPAHAKPLGTDPRTFFPFVTSAKSLASLARQAKTLAAFAASASADDFASLSYTLTARRMHHNYRIGVTASSMAELKTLLQAKADEGNFSPVPSATPKPAFVFTGQGAYYAGLGKTLLDQSKVFRSTILHLDRLAQAQGFASFMPALDGTPIEQLTALETQLALVSVQIALLALWKSWGVKPSIVTGHSLGEYAALHAAGVLTMEDTIYLVGARARLLLEKCTENTHAMLVVKGSASDVEDTLQGSQYEIACLNSPTETVIAGAVKQIDIANATLTKNGMKTTRLNLPYAFHSAQVEPILDTFEELASGVVFSAPTIPVISPLLGEVVEDAGVFNPSYLCRHARETVNFVEALETAKSEGFVADKTIWVEVGPHPICSGMVKNTFSPSINTVGSLNKSEDSWRSLSKSLVSLHTAGVPVDFSEFHRDFDDAHKLVNLPTYSFDNKNYWIQYVNDWCLHKVEPRTTVQKIENVQPAAPARSRLSTSSVHRITSESYDGPTGKIVTESDVSDPVFRAALSGHQVNNTSLCPSSIYADMALTIGDYAWKEINPGTAVPGVSCNDMEVFKPLILKNQAEGRVLEVTADVDLTKGEAKLRFQSIDTNANNQVTLHANCVVTYEDPTTWTKNWNSISYLLEGRIDTLKERLAKNQADKMSRGLAYRLFSTFVDYKAPFQGMEEVIIDGANFEGTSTVKFQTTDKDGKYHVSPFWIDSLAHLGGFILNGTTAIDTSKFVHISHGWKAIKFAEPLDKDKTYNAYVKMQPTSEANVIAGDVYFFESGKIIGVCAGLKFQRIPRTVLNTFLPPQGVSATASKPVATAAPKPVSAPKPVVAAPRPVTVAAAAVAPKPAPIAVDAGKLNKAITAKLVKPAAASASTIVSKVMAVISAESELPEEELGDDCEFSSLGIDSLLSLQILGKLREAADLDLPPHTFTDCETIGELKAYLNKAYAGDAGASDEEPILVTDDDDTSADEAASPASVATPSDFELVGAPSDSGDLLQLFRETISEQMGVPLEEVFGSNDLLSLGIDSLMNLTLCGVLREKTEIELDSDFFLTHSSVDAIAEFLNPKKAAPKPAKESPKKSSNKSTSKAASSGPARRAVSILMQGKPRTATKTLFLLPDGSGSATSYASIPAIDPSVAVFGLNCPYMTYPTEWTNGITGVAAMYLEEVRRRQPNGPYHLGGWSAGGVIAYEMTLQLLAAGEKVDSLVFLDSPCPIGLEPLPSRLHDFFAEIGLIGSDDGAKIPDWLLPHFSSSIKALDEYNPQPIPASAAARAPKVLAIWAKHGVCRYPDSPRPEVRGDESKSMKWLLNNRTDFGPNGWDGLLKGSQFTFEKVDGNHFTLMKARDQLQVMAQAIKTFV